jgi:hypothetical protein
MDFKKLNYRMFEIKKCKYEKAIGFIDRIIK